jgi:hypothetical protein
VKQSEIAIPVRVLLGVALLLCPLGWASAASAQTVPPACAPDKTLGVTLESEERGDKSALVATHEISVSAEFTDSVAGESIAPPAGVTVRGKARGSSVEFVVPIAASVPLTVSWLQAIDPSDPESDPRDPATRCAASRVVTLPILAANRSHAVLDKRGSGHGQVAFGVVPALKRPDLSPFEVSVRITGRAQLPSAKSKPYAMAVPLRTGDQIKYSKHLPSLAGLDKAGRCRYYWLTCGSVGSMVGSLEIDSDALSRGVVKADVDGGQRLLARTQPFREAARYGIGVSIFPGGGRKDRPFGYDLTVRQSGRLLARVKRAGRCVERRDSRGIFTQCRITRSSTKLG